MNSWMWPEAKGRDQSARIPLFSCGLTIGQVFPKARPGKGAKSLDPERLRDCSGGRLFCQCEGRCGQFSELSSPERGDQARGQRNRICVWIEEIRLEL